MLITKGWNCTRKFRVLEVKANRIRENQATIQAIEEQLTQTGHMQIPSGSQGVDPTSSPVASQNSGKKDQCPRVTILHNPRRFTGEDKDTRAKEDLFQPKAERVRPNDPEAVEFGDRSAQEPEVVVHNSRISSSINRNITPIQIEHNVVTPESNLNSDALWLQMS
ncbi:hypothetical protein O181_107671 [Austropuccinia psidii MF-1]|uniref:Uncharacterized protein n=1 Tax=Austropuccinia psidii MF-1 TaxID=1389203 RepID=A0A9Q3JTT6_9BASI|nr:hypothetical protein [Austropuccinia psidii MF-1]